MSDLMNASGACFSPRSHELAAIVLACVLALALCFIATLYSDPANIAPSDPVVAGFYP